MEAVEGKHPICIHASCSMRNAVERVCGGDFVVNLGKAYNGRLGEEGWRTVRWVHMQGEQTWMVFLFQKPCRYPFGVPDVR